MKKRKRKMKMARNDLLLMLLMSPIRTKVRYGGEMWLWHNDVYLCNISKKTRTKTKTKTKTKTATNDDYD